MIEPPGLTLAFCFACTTALATWLACAVFYGPLLGGALGLAPAAATFYIALRLWEPLLIALTLVATISVLSIVISIVYQVAR